MRTSTKVERSKQTEVKEKFAVLNSLTMEESKDNMMCIP